MDGIHDLGGMHGFGPIDAEPESEEPLFHHEWERRAFAVTLGCGFLGQWNLDESRHARERQHPVDYLSHSYYENWMAGLVTLLREKGLVTDAELKSGRAEAPVSADIAQRVVASSNVIPILERGGPVDVATGEEPLFGVGDRVRVSNDHPLGHTRMPRYVRGCVGEVMAHNGCHVYPDAHAKGERIGKHLYSVRFEAATLWGPSRGNDAVYVDLWEPYLERFDE